MYVRELGAGDAPRLVLLHAMKYAHDMWESQLPRLAGLFRVLAPDLPGYGQSPGPFTVEAAVEELGALAGDGEIHLCGVSLGARVALRFAAERPEAVASLVLSGCGIRAPRGLRPQRLAMRALPERFFTRESPGAGKAATIESNRALADLDLTGYLPLVRARTLVACGARDRRYLTDARRLRDGIRGAELRVVPGAGHFWNRERPELFARTLMEWALDRPLTGEASQRAH
jgi:3-oxoadipate enol-lactonase